LFVGGERAVLERQPVDPAAASKGVSRLHAFRECPDLVALGATGPVGERRGPATVILANAQRLPRAIRALHQVARPRSRRQIDKRATIRTLDGQRHRIPKSRCSRPRSNPTTISSSIVMTGTASRPVRPINSMRASVSSATFLAVNSTPWDERNSFAAWHDIQVEDQYTVTSRVVMRRPRSPRIDHPFAVPSDSFPSRPPKMCRPSLNASSTVAPPTRPPPPRRVSHPPAHSYPPPTGEV